MAKVEIYYWTACPYCTKARGLLDSKNVKYEAHNLDDDEPTRQALASRTDGRISMPQIFIDDKHIGGCDDLFDLEDAGKLDALLA